MARTITWDALQLLDFPLLCRLSKQVVYEVCSKFWYHNTILLKHTRSIPHFSISEPAEEPGIASRANTTCLLPSLQHRRLGESMTASCECCSLSMKTSDTYERSQAPVRNDKDKEKYNDRQHAVTASA
jgi:hypothetical protein